MMVITKFEASLSLSLAVSVLSYCLFASSSSGLYQLAQNASRYKVNPIFINTNMPIAGTSGRAVKGVGLRSFDCWDCGFESHRGMDVCLL